MLEYNNYEIKYKNSKQTSYTNIDDVINNAHLLSDLQKPQHSNTKVDHEGQTLKKAKYKHLSPILFVSMQRLMGKKKNRLKTKLVKALVDTGASESIISLKAAKGSPLTTSKANKRWSTAAGMLGISLKTKKLQFSLPELHNRSLPIQSY